MTFWLHPRDVIQLIFHRGVKVKDNVDFRSEDNTGPLRWVAPDRAILSLDDTESTTAKTAAIVALVNRWMRAVT